MYRTILACTLAAVASCAIDGTAQRNSDVVSPRAQFANPMQSLPQHLSHDPIFKAMICGADRVVMGTVTSAVTHEATPAEVDNGVHPPVYTVLQLAVSKQVNVGQPASQVTFRVEGGILGNRRIVNLNTGLPVVGESWAAAFTYGGDFASTTPRISRLIHVPDELVATLPGESTLNDVYWEYCNA